MKILSASILLSFISFYSIAQTFVTNGSAIKVTDTEFQLTTTGEYQAGTVWYKKKIDLRNDFEINAHLFLGYDDGGADGIAFVLQPISNTVVGEAGGYLGYTQITPSFAVEFDTWQNPEFNDPNEDHLAFLKNGDIVHNSKNNPADPYSFDVNIEDGQWHDAKFSWKASTHTVTITFLSNTYSYAEDIIKTIFGNSPYVYWGFTAGTGAAVNDERVRISKTSFHIPPTVTLITPTSHATYLAPAADIKLSATASDADGTITKVEFFNGTHLLHTEHVVPYGFVWKNVPLGNYTLTAKAYDNSGLVTTSAPVHISVVPNKPPTVNIIAPKNNQPFAAPAYIHFEADAKDLDGRITRVEFYNGSTLLRTEYKYPYTYVWKNVPLGTYTITAVAIDNWGAHTTSAPVTVRVVPQNAQIVSNRSSSVHDKTDIEEAVGLRLVPNPGIDIVNIYTTGLRQDRQATLSVIASSGVAMRTMEIKSLNKVIPLDVSLLRSGVYTIKLISGDRILYKQFLKL